MWGWGWGGVEYKKYFLESSVHENTHTIDKHFLLAPLLVQGAILSWFTLF